MDKPEDLKAPEKPSCLGKGMALLVALGTLMALWAILSLRHPLGMWEADGDYPTLTLGHALNVEYGGVRSGQRAISFAQFGHPGIPYQVASWLAFRAYQLTGVRGADPVRGVLEAPERFQLCCRVVVLLLFAGALCLLSRELRGVGLVPALAVYFSLLCYAPAWDYGLVTLGNESFALLACVLFFGQARVVLSDRTSLLRSALLGLIGGCAYLIKLNYVALPLSFGLALAVAASFRLLPIKEVARRGAAFMAGFGEALLLAAVWLTPSGLYSMGRFHWAVLTHAGLYGTSEKGVISSSVVSTFLGRVSADHYCALFLALLAAVLLAVLVVVLARAWRGGGSIETTLSGLLRVIAATGLVLAAIKHWGPHYLVPAAAILPLALAWLLGAVEQRLFRGAVTVAVLAAVLVGGFRGWTLHSAERANQAAWRAESAVVESIPLQPGEVRLWSYGVLLRQQTLLQVLAFSGRPDAGLIGQVLLPRDRVYNIWNQKVADGATAWRNVGELRWRTAAFSRVYFPNRSKIPPEFLVPGCEVLTTPRMLVVVHPPRCASSKSVPAQQTTVTP
jgi:hypothetical protein